MASVAVRGITKKFGALSVLSDIDLNVDDGEFVVLVGPSGCGKSTLLRMIAGLEAASGGKIFIGQKDVENEPPKERDIAMVFQSYALYPNMNVFRNLAFGLRMRGEAASEIDRKVRDTAEMLGLTPLLDRLPRELSGGQRQRVAMGRAIVRNPKVFLFDEPLSNLDAKLRVAMRSEIKARHLKLKTTTIYVTHDQIEAMTMADRIVVMREGRIEQIGAPFDIYHRPRNTFVAEFIGSPPMNFFRAEVEANGASEARLRLGAGQIPINGRVPPGEVTVGIRPEHLSLGGDPSATALRGTVLVVEPTGNSTHVVVAVGDSLVTVHASDSESPKPGAAVTVTPAPNRLHLFHARTGERLDTKIH